MLDRILDVTSRTLAAVAGPGETVSSVGAVCVLEAMPMENDVVEQTGRSLGPVPLSEDTPVDCDELSVTTE